MEAVTNMEFGAYNVYWGSPLVRGKKGSRLGKGKNLNFKAGPTKPRPAGSSKKHCSSELCVRLKWMDFYIPVPVLLRRLGMV